MDLALVTPVDALEQLGERLVRASARASARVRRARFGLLTIKSLNI